jgi:UDP-N-acetylglucosamine 3-dehydrogenase
VSIVTMWDQHTEPAVAALEAGKPHLPLEPRYRMAKQAVAEGKIGKIVAMNSRRNIPAAWTPAILNQIGPIVGDAIHDTDLMLWLTRDRIVSAYAQTVNVRGLKYPDIGQTMYRFAGGATETLETVWCMPENIDERMSIIGDAGIIHIQDRFPNLGIVSSDKLHSPDTAYWPVFDGIRGGALREEFSYFASCALKGEAPAIGPEDAAAALEATVAAEESARAGEIVRIKA